MTSVPSIPERTRKPTRLDNTSITADEIREYLSPLPDTFFVTPDSETGSILIGNDALAFAITKSTIDDGNALHAAKETFPQLLDAMAAKYSELADDYRKRAMFEPQREVLVHVERDHSPVEETDGLMAPPPRH